MGERRTWAGTDLAAAAAAAITRLKISHIPTFTNSRERVWSVLETRRAATDSTTSGCGANLTRRGREEPGAVVK